MDTKVPCGVEKLLAKNVAQTPLKWAKCHGHQNVLDLLRNAGADEEI